LCLQDVISAILVGVWLLQVQKSIDSILREFEGLQKSVFEFSLSQGSNSCQEIVGFSMGWTYSLVFSLFQGILVVLLTSEVVLKLVFREQLIAASIVMDHKQSGNSVMLRKRILRSSDTLDHILIASLDRYSASSRLRRQRYLFLMYAAAPIYVLLD
jgi:hypothetical protein